MAEARQRSWPWLVLGLAAVAFGLFVRSWQLGAQILIDDEWHAINRLLRASGAADIATHFGLADYSIPLTLLFRFFYDNGGLTDAVVRLPMLVSGALLLAAAPWLTRRLLPLPLRATWVGLLAISPLMVYHSRTARPYAITTLLCFIALFAFREWWQAGERRWRWAAAYVAATFLAGWLHLIALSFALAPFLFHGLLALRDLVSPADRARGWRRLRDLAALGLAVALPLALALLPPLLTDAAALAAKTGTGSATWGSALRTLLICSGIASPWLLAALLVAALVGIVDLARRDRGLVAYLGFVVVVAVAAIAASHAAWLQHPLNFARYIQPAVPFLLLALAAGIVRIVAVVRLDAVAAGLVALALGGLVRAGPMPTWLYAPNQFVTDPYFQFDYDPAHNPYLTQLPHGPIPAFYRELAGVPRGRLTLVEMPWSLETDSDPQPLYQAVHRQNIRIALTTPDCGVSDYGNYPETASGMQLRNFVHLSSLLRERTHDADYLVVHLRAWPDPAHPPAGWPDLSACLPRIEAQLGPPTYRDADIEVFDLRRR